MRFAPRSSHDIETEVKTNAAKFAPWPSGTYDFEVLSAEDATSGRGNEMIVVELAVFNQRGERRTVKDYLLEEMAVKLRHAVEACGLVREYERGELNAIDFLGRAGKLKFGIQPPKDGYGAKNTVRDYVSEPAQQRAEERAAQKVPARAPVAAGGGGIIDDDIPFGAEWR